MDKEKKKLNVQYIYGDSYGKIKLMINGKEYEYQFPFPHTVFKEKYWEYPKYKNRGRLLKAINSFLIKDPYRRELKQLNLFEIYKKQKNLCLKKKK